MYVHVRQPEEQPVAFISLTSPSFSNLVYVCSFPNPISDCVCVCGVCVCGGGGGGVRIYYKFFLDKLSIAYTNYIT